MALYGDLITAIPDTLFICFFYVRNFNKTAINGTESLILCLMVGSCCLHWTAWAKSHRTLSVLAFVVKMLCITANHVSGWPYDDSAILVPNLLWMIFLHLGGNYMHDKTVKAAKIVFAFACITVSTVFSAADLDVESTLIKCAAATAFALFLHLQVGLGDGWKWKDEYCYARVARLILAAIYAHHLTCEIVNITQTADYMAEGCFNLLKIGILASMGIVATGAFQDQMGMKQSLQRLLILNENQMADQAEVMEMTRVALEASDNGIAITDDQHDIIWSNRALHNLVGWSSGGTETTNSCLSDAMKLTGDILQQFKSCFDKSQKSMELRIEEKDVRIIVVPFTFSRNGRRSLRRYLVSMADITQARALARAEKAAEQAALQKAAMRESMEALTHELRTPLQGIIGTTSLVFDRTNVSPEEM